MKRVTLDPLEAQPEMPLAVTPDTADPLVDASRRASALEPVDPRVLGRVDVNAHRPRTPRWRVADPTPPDPKALDARVSALAADIAAALRQAGDPFDGGAGAALSPETRLFPAASPALGEAPDTTGQKKESENASSRIGPIRFLERFPVVAPPARAGATRNATTREAARGAPDSLWYDAASRTWTREVFPTGQRPESEADAVSNVRASSREDVCTLERWLDASVAATRLSPPRGFVHRADVCRTDARARAADETSPAPQKVSHLSAARETCDAAIEAFHATFETIARDVVTECRDRAALLRRVWGFNATFFELRGAANAAPALFAATREARAARASSRRAQAETDALRKSLDAATARARRAERAREKQLDTSRMQIFSLTKKLRDVARASAEARDASARACRRENELREALHATRARLALAKSKTHASAWRSIARRLVSLSRAEAFRTARRVVAETARADAACDAATRALVRDVAEAETVAHLESANACLVAERGRGAALAERVAALERGAAEAARAAETAETRNRDARREATRWREARDDARCMAREARAESGTVRAALAAAERGLGEFRLETERLSEQARVATARAEAAESALSEARETLARADEASRRREMFLKRARAAAAARNDAVAGLVAEIAVAEALDVETATKREEEEEEEQRLEDDSEDEDGIAVLVSADVRLAFVSRAAARLLRETRASKDAALREKFALETRLDVVANDAARSAAAAATFSANLKACSAAREALYMNARALEHRLAKRESALERAEAEAERARRDASVAARESAATKAAAATLEACVADRDARLAAAAQRLERSEAQAVDALLVELALETANDDARERLSAADAARAAERDCFSRKLLATRRRETQTRTRLETDRRALRVARGARDALAREVVELELAKRLVADERDAALGRAHALAEGRDACRGALAEAKRNAEKRNAERETEEASESARRAETERAETEARAFFFASASAAARAAFLETRDALLAAVATHRDAREEVRNARAEIEPVTAMVRDAKRIRARRAEARAAQRRDAATQSDDAHSACGRRVEASAKEKHALLRLKG